MKLATFEKAGQRRIGVVLDGDASLLDLAAAHQAATDASSPHLTDMLALIDGSPEALTLARACLATPLAATIYPLSAARLPAPSRPPNIGLNI